MKKLAMVVLALMALAAVPAWAGAVNPADYPLASQADMVGDRDGYQGKKVQIKGPFLFTGSDFCYQIRKTKINTRDYFCFALGTPSLVRLYLKKDHPQAEELLNLRKGVVVMAYGVFDYLGGDYNYMVIDEIAVEPAP